MPSCVDIPSFEDVFEFGCDVEFSRLEADREKNKVSFADAVFRDEGLKL